MELSRIDQIALNGATGEHYKYEEVAEKILEFLYEGHSKGYELAKATVVALLVENFPNGD